MSEEIRVFKNGRVVVKDGLVTATVDMRKEGIRRWSVEDRRAKYRFYYGPFSSNPNDSESGISELDCLLLSSNPSIDKKLAVARKMLNLHFREDVMEAA